MLESRAPHVSVEGFEGPLDMLLELIEEQRLDILTVRLGDLAEAYLARIQGLAALPTEEVAGFLVIGARLVLIKARSLLPQEGAELQAEAQESELRERLLEYQVVRERAAALRTRLAGGQRAFHREGGGVDLPPRGGDVAALSAAWEKVLGLARSAREEDLVAPGERYNVEDRAREIEELLRSNERVAFSALVAERPTLRFAVVTFLALLDLFRRGLVDLEQRELFAEITIRLRERSDGG